MTSAIPAGVSEGDLKLMYYSPERGEYVPVEGGYTVDTTNNTVTGQVNHFTDFVLAYVPSEEGVPTAPTGLTATAVSASQINLSWTAVSGATSYNVHKSTDGVTYTDVASTGSVSYSVSSGLSASTLYYFKVTASNASGEGASSGAASATTNASAPGGGSYTPPIVITTTTPTSTPITTTTPIITTTTPAQAEEKKAGSDIKVNPIMEKVVSLLESLGIKTQSKVVVQDLNKGSFQPGEQMKFRYQYKNEGLKTLKVKIIRQLLNAKGKVLKTATAIKNLKPGAVFKSDVKDTISKTQTPGDYTVKIKILDKSNKPLEDNNFKFTVEKSKKKVFSMGTAAQAESDILFDQALLSKIKSGGAVPLMIRVKYSYTNNSGVKHQVKMVRELVDGDGKVVSSKAGKWQMSVGEKESMSAYQVLGPSLPAGDYQIRIRAYDWTTKELLAENSLGFAIELK